MFLTFSNMTHLPTRSALFRYITQCIVVIPYRRFGKTYRSRLEPSKFHADERKGGRTEGQT